MKNRILIASLIILISCKKEIQLQNRELALNDLNFSTEKIVIEEIPELPEKRYFHFVIKVENKSDKKIKIPVNGILFKEKSENNPSLFRLKTNNDSFACFSFLFKNLTDTIYISPNKANYVLLSLKDNINVDSLKSEMPYFNYDLNQAGFKSFEMQKKNTLWITVNHKLNIEDAVKLVHGKFTIKN